MIKFFHDMLNCHAPGELVDGVRDGLGRDAFPRQRRLQQQRLRYVLRRRRARSHHLQGLILFDFSLFQNMLNLHLFNLQGLCQLRGREVGRVEGVLQGLVDEGWGVITCKEKGMIMDEDSKHYF